MSTIEDVRAAEKKVQEVLDALKKADPQDLNHLSAELRNATDHYARAKQNSAPKPRPCNNPYFQGLYVWSSYRNRS